MGFEKLFSILFVYYCVVIQVYGQDCVIPQRVENLIISSNATLSWDVNPNEPCEITAFQVEIVGDFGDNYRFRIGMRYVDLSFLEICEKWVFTVTPFSGGIIGDPRSLTDYIPLPPSADLSLRYFNVTPVGGNEIRVDWDLNSHTYGDCTLYYRLAIYDEDKGITRDYYVHGSSFHFSFLSPCISYELSIRAVNRAHPIIEGPVRTTSFEVPEEPQSAPTLNSIEIEPTTVTLTWNLEGGNRCPLRALHANGGSLFNVSVDLMNQVAPQSVPIQITSLTPNRMYYMTVTVENSAGLSRATPIAVQTTEYSPT